MKIAIVDDSQFMRRLISAVVRQVDPSAEVIEYSDAAKALAELPGMNPDLLTLDMLMPGMTGIAFLEELRKTELRPRIIVVTADVQKSVRQRCVELGASGFIDKPITPEKLQAALGQLILA